MFKIATFIIFIFGSCQPKQTIRLELKNTSEGDVAIKMYHNLEEQTVVIQKNKSHLLREEVFAVFSTIWFRDVGYKDSIRVFYKNVYYQTDKPCGSLQVAEDVLVGCTSKGTKSLYDAKDVFVFDSAYFRE